MDIQSVYGRHVELKRSGRTWKGCCPFHGERTPSFHVYPEDKHFKCYGCGEGGDVFKFLQKVQGKEFPEVVRALAAEVGVEIPETGPEPEEARRARQERNAVLLALDAAARYWTARLGHESGAHGRRYLASRGVSVELAKSFRLGIAAQEWNDLAARLVKKGVAEDSIDKAGLTVEGKKGRYDRFRGRLMFPICSPDGDVIGFGARAMGDEGGAKYINTPETAVYKKSKVLYGIDLARETIRRTRSAILVEGYFDVIGLHGVGVANAVAVCGTALTPEHLELLKRYDCREITLLFDGDDAGVKAIAKAAMALLPSGLSGKVAVLATPGGGKVDPDEFARKEGRTGVDKLLQGAAPLTEFLVDRAIASHLGAAVSDASVEAKLGAVKELKPFVLAMPEGLSRTTFEGRIAERLQLDPEALRAELEGRRMRRAPTPSQNGAARPAGRPWEGRSGAGRPGRVQSIFKQPALDALALLAAYPELAPVAEEEALPALFPEGPLADLARELLRAEVPLEKVLGRVAVAGPAAVHRVRDLAGPARPRREEAEHELRRAMLKARIDALQREYELVIREITKQGSHPTEDLTTGGLTLNRRLTDLKKRLATLERG